MYAGALRPPSGFPPFFSFCRACPRPQSARRPGTTPFFSHRGHADSRPLCVADTDAQPVAPLSHRAWAGASKPLAAPPHNHPRRRFNGVGLLRDDAVSRMDELTEPAWVRLDMMTCAGELSTGHLGGSNTSGGDIFHKNVENYRNSQVLFDQSYQRAPCNPEVNTTDRLSNVAAGNSQVASAGKNDCCTGQNTSHERVCIQGTKRSTPGQSNKNEILQFVSIFNLLKLFTTTLFYKINEEYLSHNIFIKQADYSKSDCRNMTYNTAFYKKDRIISTLKIACLSLSVSARSAVRKRHAVIAFRSAIRYPVGIYSTAFHHNLHFNFFHGDCPWGNFLQGEPSWDHSTACN